MSFTIRRVTAADYDDVRRITRDAYLHAGYFSDPFHPYVRILTDVEHRAEHAEAGTGRCRRWNGQYCSTPRLD